MCGWRCEFTHVHSGVGGCLLKIFVVLIRESYIDSHGCLSPCAIVVGAPFYNFITSITHQLGGGVKWNSSNF